MSNGSESMSPEEFAKLMGAYPEPAHNPLPAYGGYMDNSPANFAWVNNNDYFGAEDEYESMYSQLENKLMKMIDDGYQPSDIDLEEVVSEVHDPNSDSGSSGIFQMLMNDGAEMLRENETFEAFQGNPEFEEKNYYGAEKKNCGCGQDPCITYGADTDLTPTNHMNNSIGQVVPITNPMELPTNLIETEAGGGPEGQITPDTFEAGTYLDVEPDDMDMLALNGRWWSNDGITEADLKAAGLTTKDDLKGTLEYMEMKEEMWGDSANDVATVILRKYGRGAEETFEAPYGGAGALMDIGKDTPLADFTGKELAESSAIHGDFDQASLNYSGHQNLEVRAEDEMTRMQVSIGCPSGSTKDFTKIFDVNVRGSDLEYLTSDLEDEIKGRVASWNKTYEAEMEQLTKTIADVSNRFDESLGQIEVDDIDGDIDEIENVVLKIKDPMGDVVDEVTIDSDMIPDDWDDYYMAEGKMGTGVKLGLAGLVGVMLANYALPHAKKMFNSDTATATQDMLENDPELVENPNTGDLDPAQYEELVVESTGYAVDVIPMGLDGSFMGSRFQALPTERYVEYNEPGIGAHTDIALHRDEIYLEPEQAMVQASENVVKESQAPGQSPYNSITGEENPDFDFRVLKETRTVSLDPAVKPFIPQSMAGYTGNANTPPSVLNKMFNIGVLGQTPLFVAGQGDMGSSHTGSRNAIPDSLGIAGSVGGPLSDQVNANYTDGTTSMSLAQWSIENTVSQTSDTEAVVIDRSSGMMKRIRRV